MAICNACGEWTEPPILERTGDVIETMCPHCRHRAPFARHPLWWIAGSLGSGKSTLVPLLRRHLPGYVVFEGEAIDYWRFEGEPGEYSSLYNQWLKVAHEIALNGYPVVFVATATPADLDACTLRCRFSAIYYLGLTCSEEAQTQRLLARPAWRNSSAPEFIRDTCNFSRYLEECARRSGSPITLCDTTEMTPEASAERIAAWVRECRVSSR